ncbi:MAG: hypothetical protein FWE49_05300, partial [Synergistaceae bacterium]|nr:hypothetical protein [Synergistaceae bacterium]
TEASELLAQALSIYEDEAVSIYAEIVKQRIVEEEDLKERASILRKEADSLFKDKKHTEAFSLYRNSLEIWKDEELESWLTNEEKEFNEAQALQLRKNAEQLLRRNRRDEAIQVYRESLKFAFDKTADGLVKEADAKAARARADELIKEAEAHIKQNQPEEALEKYRLALTKVPNDQKLKGEIDKLENALLKAVSEPGDAALSDDAKPEENAESQDDSEQLKAADKLFKEANALYSQKKYNEALLKYKESYELSKNSKLSEFIDRFEKTIEDVEKANSIVREANELYRQGKFQEAFEKYQESLKVYKNPKVEEFIKKIEPLIKQNSE